MSREWNQGSITVTEKKCSYCTEYLRLVEPPPSIMEPNELICMNPDCVINEVYYDG